MRSTPIGWRNLPQGHPAPPHQGDQAEATSDQFRASLDRHIDKLIEEEEEMWDDRLIHDYAASLLRELKAWIETGA